MRRRATLALLLLSCATLVCGGEAKVDVSLSPIGVLDLEAVFHTAKFYTTRMEALKGEKEEAEKALQAMEGQEKQLQGNLEGLSKTNERYARFEDELEQLRFKRKRFFERVRTGLDRRQVAILKQTFEELRAHLKAFAAERGLKLVHLAPSANLNAPTMPDLQLQLGLQAVLYFDPALDITEPFVAYLNARYAAAQAGAGAAPAPADGPKPDAAPPAPVEPKSQPALQP